MTTSTPDTFEALVSVLTTTQPRALQIGGGGTSRQVGDGGRAVDGILLGMRGIAGITAYDPAECVVTVRAGTAVRELARVVDAQGQYLPWDPPMAGAEATVGGMIATGLNGPGRYRYGGVRDFVIGARVVDGRGRMITSGGQVVKNAAGFLLHHALVGSGGRLGVIAEVSLKVFPRPEATRTLVARAASRAEALAAYERLRLATLDLDALDLDLTERLVSARLAGAAEVLGARAERVCRALQAAADTLTGAEEARHWRDMAPTAWSAAGATVKIPTTPSRLAAALDALAPLGPCRVSAGGAVVYLHSAEPLPAIDTVLRTCERPGSVVRGAGFGTHLGVGGSTAFHDRVRATLDPDGRFC